MITAGEVLKNKREKLGKSLDTASLDTKIQRRFLQYIEENKFSYFDSEVFLTGFIKIYAKYLNLDVGKVLALYRRSNPKRAESTPKKEISKESRKLPKFSIKMITPKIVITILLSLFLITIIGYVGFQIYKFQSPPKLSILQPKPDIEVTSEQILVKVQSDSDINIEINGLPAEETDQGNYEKEIKLIEGRNIITVKARKEGNNSLESVKSVKITYIKELQPEEQTSEEEIQENKITLEIIDSPAWIRLDIDDENKISKVVDPSRTEYEINEKLYIITGRLSSTKLYYNQEIVEWGINKTTGVAELTCTVVDSSLKCE